MTTPRGPAGAPDPYAEWDAAYVLGSLSPSERREFEAHLAGCADCRAAVGELAGMPGLLSALPAEDAEFLDRGADGGTDEAEPGPGNGTAVVVPLADLARRARQSRVRRWSLGAVAAAVLAVAGVLTGMTLDAAVPGDDTGAVRAVDVEVELAPVGAADVHASLAASSRPWGTLLQWSCRYPSAAGPYEDVTYELVVVDRAGQRRTVATWEAAGDSADGLEASSAVALDDVARVEIAVVGGTTPLASADV